MKSLHLYKNNGRLWKENGIKVFAKNKQWLKIPFTGEVS